MSVIIETTLGDITVDLYVEERPRCCLNFLKLCKVKYYNYCLFHNVQRNFIAQTGDPTGSGRGGESIFRMIYGDQAKFFDAEKLPKIKHTSPGLISMVNDGNGFHGSQFLITLGENLDSLDDVHTVFGEVAEGMEVAMKINEAFCDKESRPFQDIRITHTVVLDDPLDDPPGLEIPDRSPEPTKEQLEGSFRIGADEVINDDEGIDEEELKEREEKKEAKHSAQVLEIIGDIPDVDVKPPDNVLFVCKLNSITTDEDLEIIFARFGTIVSCEIIRDYKTGDSLQYAFIEFDSPDSCEKAYKKMDNVLIDDRRIHVDFSQSVSKINFPQGRVTKADLQGNNKPSNEPKHNSSQIKPKTEPPSRNNRRDNSPRHRRHDVTPPLRHHQDRVVTHARRERSRENERRRHNDDTTRRIRHDDSTNRRRERSPRKKSRRDVTPPRHDRRHRDESESKARRKNDRGTNEKRHRRDAAAPSSGDDVIVESRNNKRRDVTPPRKKQKRRAGTSPPSARRQRQDESSSSGFDSEEERNAKKKLKKQRKKEAKKLEKKKKKSSTSDSDVTSSGEEEVRCGKHRKRSVHKDDVIRRKSHKHRS